MILHLPDLKELFFYSFFKASLSISRALYKSSISTYSLIFIAPTGLALLQYLQ